ncbi:hypothetical protein C2E23DRAFT_811858 [Lenzites betulinus]|nr:hypothetical protein C2E23DRAFT_811858 [Lenzites betulinus]
MSERIDIHDPKLRLYRHPGIRQRSDSKRLDYSTELKEACQKTPASASPTNVICKVCGLEMRPRGTLYKQGFAGATGYICTNNHFVIPMQDGPSDELLLEIETIRASDIAAGKARRPDAGMRRAGGSQLDANDAAMAMRLALEEGTLEEQALHLNEMPFANVANRGSGTNARAGTLNTRTRSSNARAGPSNAAAALEDEVIELSDDEGGRSATETLDGNDALDQGYSDDEYEQHFTLASMELEDIHGVPEEHSHEVLHRIDPYILAIRYQEEDEHNWQDLNMRFVTIVYWAMNGILPSFIRVRVRCSSMCLLDDYPMFSGINGKIDVWHPDDMGWLDGHSRTRGIQVKADDLALIVRHPSAFRCPSLGKVLNALAILAEPLERQAGAGGEAVLHEKKISQRQRTVDAVTFVVWRPNLVRAHCVKERLPSTRNVYIRNSGLWDLIAPLEIVDMWDPKTSQWRPRRTASSFHIDQSTHTILVRPPGAADLRHVGLEIEGLALPMTETPERNPRKRARK